MLYCKRSPSRITNSNILHFPYKCALDVLQKLFQQMYIIIKVSSACNFYIFLVQKCLSNFCFVKKSCMLHVSNSFHILLQSYWRLPETKYETIQCIHALHSNRL